MCVCVCVCVCVGEHREGRWIMCATAGCQQLLIEHSPELPGQPSLNDSSWTLRLAVR